MEERVYGRRTEERENVVCTRGEYKEQIVSTPNKTVHVSEILNRRKRLFLREGKNNKEIEKKM